MTDPLSCGRDTQLRNAIGHPVSWEPSIAFLKASIAFILIGCAAFEIVLLTSFPDETGRALLDMVLMLVAVIAWFFLNRNMVRSAVWVLGGGVWAYITVTSFFAGGVNSVIIIVYPLTILLSGWLIGTRAAVVFALLSTAATLGFVLFEWLEILPAAFGTLPQLRWIVQSAVFMFSAVLIYYIVDSYRNRLEEVQSLSDRLALRTAEVQAREADLNRAQAVAKIGSWAYDLVSDVMRLSAETCRIFGLPEGTSGSRETYIARVHPDDRAQVIGAWQAALNGAVFDHEHRIVVGKAIRWVRQKAEFEFTSDGLPLKAVGISREITERKQAEADIVAAKNQLQAVLDAIPDLLFEVGVDGRIYSYHSHRTELLATPPEAFLGKLLCEVVPPDVAKVCMSAISEAAENGWSTGKVYSLPLPSGDRWFEISVAAAARVEGQERRFIFLARDITSRKTAADQIQHLAFYDPLTLLPNRRLLLDRLGQVLASSTRTKRSGALLFIDLDNFKDLNDTLGHNIGDLLLQQVSKRVAASLREGDTVARLGGDEFVVMLQDLSENPQEAATQAEAVGEKILNNLNHAYQLSGLEHRSTASIGIALFGDRKATIDELLKRADLAMYQAKAAGRNTLRFFEPNMQAVISARTALETALREALLKGQFVLHYQAQVVGEGRLAGVEALVRWRHPDRGMIPPFEFIPLAEETGLILSLGQWVLETACAQLAIWAARPEMAHLTIAVNVSARQFHHRDFVDQVLAVLDYSGAKPERLKLELTESLMLHNVEDIIAKMTALKAEGVGFAMDDFGTGYSSLSYLKRLPLDQLKIDQGFVRDILTDLNDAAIAKMVVALADSMGLAVIAEGVETAAQRDFLAQNGCHGFQGYLFSRPLPLEEFEEFAQRAWRMSDHEAANSASTIITAASAVPG